MVTPLSRFVKMADENARVIEILEENTQNAEKDVETVSSTMPNVVVGAEDVAIENASLDQLEPQSEVGDISHEPLNVEENKNEGLDARAQETMIDQPLMPEEHTDNVLSVVQEADENQVLDKNVASESVPQPSSREDLVETKDVPGVDVKDIRDQSNTPPIVITKENEADNDDVPHIVNILSPNGEETQSIASSFEVPVYNRAELFERYQQAIEERSSLQTLNSQLQHKLAEYFKKKKTDERPQEIEKNVNDQEQRYIKYLANLDELQSELSEEQDSYKEQIEELKERCVDKQSKVEEVRRDFAKHKSEVAKQALNSRSGRAIPVKDIEQYQLLEQKKDHEVMLVRLENIKLKNRLKKREMQLKAKEELAEGLHLIDFEQLKIENQTYNEKIEERNEELLKLRKKITENRHARLKDICIQLLKPLDNRE